MITTRTFVVTVVARKDIPGLADKIGGRLWSLDGLAELLQEPVRVTEMPSEINCGYALPDHLDREAKAYGKSMCADSIEHGEVA